MAGAEATIDIARPTAEVYRFLADGLNNPKWRPAVVEVSLISGVAGTVGAVYRQRLKGPLGHVSGDYRIVEALPDTRIKFEVVSGPARPTGLFEIEATRDGARVRFTLSFQPKGLMRLMNRMIQKTMEGEVARLSALKTVLEGT